MCTAESMASHCTGLATVEFGKDCLSNALAMSSLPMKLYSVSQCDKILVAKVKGHSRVPLGRSVKEGQGKMRRMILKSDLLILIIVTFNNIII